MGLFEIISVGRSRSTTKIDLSFDFVFRVHVSTKFARGSLGKVNGLDDFEARELLSVRVAALAERMKDAVEHSSLKADLMVHMWDGKVTREGEIQDGSTETT
jgi:hypothetical protein